MEDDPEGVIAAKVAALTRRLFIDRQSALTALTWLAGGAAALSEEQIKIRPTRAFQRGFAQAVPPCGKEASEYLDLYAGELESFLSVPRRDAPRDPFVAELALDRGVVLLVSAATLAKIAEAVLHRPELLSLSLRWTSGQQDAFFALMRILGESLASGTVDLTLAESGRLLLEKWTQLRGQDRRVDAAVGALILQLAKQPYRAVLARLFYDGLGRALLESGGRDWVRAIIEDVARQLRGLSKGMHRSADDLVSTLQLTVQITKLLR